MFAHNTQFDFKILNGFEYLLRNEWNLKSFYVKNKVFILVFEKEITSKLKYTLHIWDTMNFVNKKLEQLGKSINLPKLEIDFNNTDIKSLEIYCKRDTEIIYLFIRKLVKFLEINDLSRIKATAGSLSLNIFRHKFYKPEQENTKIYIHDWKKAINLERKSYKGGITDNFKVGTFNDIYKLDVNSEYPYIMKTYSLPTKLLFYSHESLLSQKELFTLYNKSKEIGYGIIAKVSIEIAKNSAYILHKFDSKSIFAYGKFKTTLCLPELLFIENEINCRILHIHEISIYKMEKIFKEFIEFFYKERLKNKRNGNSVYVEFTKLIMNTLYGKFGQKDIIYKELNINDDFIKDYSEIIKLMILKKKHLLSNNFIIYLGTIINECEVYIINKRLFILKHLETNSKDSFVAISSFITSYARMLLVKYLKIAKRENVYYVDTDSLFINREGYELLENEGCINENELGMLKVEGFGTTTLYAPKFYDFNDSRKCKGIKKDSKLLIENEKIAKYEIYQWQKLKADLKEGIKNIQLIHTTTKTINKIYDKGKLDDFGNVIPFHVSEILT